MWLNAAWLSTKENLSIAIVSPYTAQVISIQENLEEKYEGCDGFDLNVVTIDNVREKDIIILLTVRADCHSSMGIVGNEKINVPLTMAR